MARKRSEICEKAREARRKARVDGFYPVDVERIAESMGYRIEFFEHTPATAGVAGAVSFADKAIYLDAEAPVRLQMLIIAHELGHVFFHSEERPEGIADLADVVESRDSQAMDDLETEAIWFADSLLMPVDVFTEAWVEFNGDTPRVARKFGVPDHIAEAKARALELTSRHNFSGPSSSAVHAVDYPKEEKI